MTEPTLADKELAAGLLESMRPRLLLALDAAKARGREEGKAMARDEAVKAFRMDELDAVMVSADKWLEGDQLRNNPATRAADAREVALKATEKAQSDLTKARAALDLCREMRSKVESIERGEDWEGGEPSIVACRLLGEIKQAADVAARVLSQTEVRP
jgi:hypothetical protein